jgi:Tfp pilus assembly protein PilN
MNNASFLPDDYLALKAERRTNLISLSLFAVVMTAVIGAFFVTNRQARMVKDLQDSINGQYAQAGLQIQELTQLERQKQEMLDKAELASALVERVPRSILLAELINRMPDKLALLEFTLKSEKVKAPPPQAAMPENKDRLTPKGPDRAKTKQQAAETAQKVEPPRYQVNITMVGIAPTDLEVSKYMAELNAYPLLRDVTLEYSEQKEIEGHTMRQFKINLSLDANGDVRRVDPLQVPRVKDPMADDIQMTTPKAPKGPGKVWPQEGR